MFHRFKKLEPDLVTVAAGPFVMGSTPEQAAAAAAQFGIPLALCQEEMPLQPVTLAAFAISRGPISCAEYLAFIVATDEATPDYWAGDDPPPALRDHPVVGVRWNTARAYCRWLSTATGRSFRLPSEAEWEKAARGDGRVFPWGDDWEPSYCNTAECGPGATTPIGSYPQDTSPYGCVDMAGNVEEWTASIYRPYPGAAATEVTEKRVVARGGSWSGRGDLARGTRRYCSDQSPLSLARGFRIVCTDE
jgi:toxoflavin biosynthesis protein ToxD